MKYKRNKNSVGYSESFIFRAACHFCGSCPKSRVFDLTQPFLGSRIENFRRMYYRNYSISSARVTYVGKLVKNTGHYYGNFYPTLFLRKKEFGNHKFMICECGKTSWYFKENSPQRSLNKIKF